MDQRSQFNLHSEKSRQAIQKLIDKFGPHARFDSANPVEMTVDELCEVLLCLSRCDVLLTLADHLIKTLAESEQ
jgi:hypothetical protein